MKKSLVYLSSIIFVSLFTISSVDAFPSFKKKEGPAAPTVAEKEVGVNFDSLIKDAEAAETAISVVKAKMTELQKKSKSMAENQKTFSRDSDPAQIYAIENLIATFNLATDSMLSAHRLCLTGFKELKKIKAKGDKSYKAGTDTILQAAALSECMEWLYPLLQADMVIIYKYLKARGKPPANAGELQKCINSIITAFEDKKKVFGGSKKGEINAEQTLGDDVESAESNVKDKTLRQAIETYNKNIKKLEECEDIILEYSKGIEEYLENDDLNNLKESSEKHYEVIKESPKSKEAEDIEDSMTKKRKKEFEYSKKPRSKEYEDLPSRKKQAGRNHR